MEDIRQKIFLVDSFDNFDTLALRVFAYQYKHNNCYNQWCNLLNKSPKNVSKITQIPFLPISLFKSHKIVSQQKEPLGYFLSSGTGNMTRSYHYIFDYSLYEQSFNASFAQFFSSPSNYCFIALLPNYLEQGHSSLIYMIDSFVKQSPYNESGFYKDNLNNVICVLKDLERRGVKTILFGVTYALLDLIELEHLSLNNTLVFETGGMKGRREEISKTALHALLKEGFGVEKIYSEYGMCELFSQAYSKGDGVFECPKQMKVILSDVYDPLSAAPQGKSGIINIIDLANIDSCAFIATQDLGKMVSNNSFELLGRIEGADIRGCNLLYTE